MPDPQFGILHVFNSKKRMSVFCVSAESLGYRWLKDNGFKKAEASKEKKREVAVNCLFNVGNVSPKINN